MSCRAPKRSQRTRDTKEAREMRDEIASTAQALVAGDKGLLAIDESTGT